MKPEKSRFKALAIGTKFTKDGQKYRKISDTHCFAVKENGVGRVHQKIPFARNTNCIPYGEPKQIAV